MRRGAGVPPAVARASCPCRFTAKARPERSEGMAVPQLAGGTCPERSEGMSTPHRASARAATRAAPTMASIPASGLLLRRIQPGVRRRS
jgi:hypothetical protein